MASAIYRMGAAGWTVQSHDRVESTNDLARNLTAWQAVMAGSQSGGRGRYGRRFESGPGGLWITAVVPATPPASQWVGFSLVVGLHLLRMLERLGVVGARLRWPNDLMVNDRKLAGLLIEQGGHETLSVGLGLNITNEPWKDDPALKGIACSLAEFLKPVPSPEEMAAHVLDAISEAHATLEMTGLKPTIESLNQLWKPCAVTVHLHEGDSITGVFRGLDRTGNLEISNSFGERVVILHQNVKQLVEKE